MTITCGGASEPESKVVGARVFLVPLLGLLLAALGAACSRPNPAYIPRTDTGGAGGTGGSGGTGGTGGSGGFVYTGPPIHCVGDYQECARETFNGNMVVCDHTETSQIDSLLCPTTAAPNPVQACHDAFCPNHEPCNISSQSNFVTINGPNGAPAPICGSTDAQQTLQVVCTLNVRRCNGFQGPACINLANTDEGPTTVCWNPNAETAVQRCADPS